MSEIELIGPIYSQLLEEFGFDYCEKDLWMLAENLAERIVNAQPTLNPNQQIVLEWFKKKYKNPIIINPVAVIFSLHDGYAENEHSEVSEAYGELTDKEEAQVLRVFSAWVLEQEKSDE